MAEPAGGPPVLPTTALTGVPGRATVVVVSDVGEPLRIVEDEPISWPDEEPLAVPTEPQPAAVPSSSRFRPDSVAG
jgi:hypothetical protein